MNRKIKMSSFVSIIFYLCISIPAFAATVTHSYDELNRLVRTVYEANGTTTTIDYEYDAAGNRTRYISLAGVIEPVPDIKANDSDGPVDLNLGDTLSVTAEFDPGDYPGYPADWWVLADAPFGWYYYDAGTETWLPGFHVSYQGPLFELTPPSEVLNISDLPAGGYTFYFGVDGTRNGNLDDPLYYDSVEVSITP